MSFFHLIFGKRPLPPARPGELGQRGLSRIGLALMAGGAALLAFIVAALSK